MLRRALAVAVLVALVAPPARANGRFPLAQHVLVGPGHGSDLIVLRTTFGLVVSRDGGRSFRWICEEALEYAGLWDPPIAIRADGTIYAGLPDGLIQTRDGCRFERNVSVGATLVQDLANDADGAVVLGVEARSGAANHVLASRDGVAFARLGGGVPGALFATVDAAPSMPSRVYATALDEATRRPRVYRSDDGGATLALAGGDLLGGEDAYLSAVDPTAPDRIYVRSNRGEGTMLLRSDDAGRSFTRVVETPDPMLGFAIADDGRRVWVGGTASGLLRSDDGGRTFARVATTRVTCLRYHAGALYLCADWQREGFALARWRDGAAAPEPLLALHQIEGAVECAAGTTVRDVCAARWPVQRALVTPRDAGTTIDAGSARDAGERDAVPSGFDAANGDAGERTGGGGCGCAAASGGQRGVGAAVAAVLFACGRRRRRSGVERAAR
jgi:photosystem II stability/assembly factor-like uncharacterized protein